MLHRAGRRRELRGRPTPRRQQRERGLRTGQVRSVTNLCGGHAGDGVKVEMAECVLQQEILWMFMCRQSENWSNCARCKQTLLARMNMRQSRRLVSRVHALSLLLLLSREGGPASAARGVLKKKNQTTKPRNQLCLPHKAQPTRVSILDCSKSADNIKTERSIFATRRLAGHTATIEITSYN
jgi:hypothetical protein